MVRKLSDELGRIVGEDLHKVFRREIEEGDYLPHEDFGSCEARASAILEAAMPRARHVLALAIMKHREEKHEEAYTAEKAAVEAELDPGDISIGLMGWWNH